MQSTPQKTRKRDIHGSMKTEKLAAKILPILVRQAKAKKTITYNALAEEVGTHRRVIGQCLGIIGNTLAKMKEEPPLINACVVKQKTGEPSGGIDEFMEQRLSKIKESERQLAIRLFQEESFCYSKWNEILKKLSLNPAVGKLQNGSPSKHLGGSGESDAHKKFKEFVRQHPELIPLPKNMDSSVEYELKSGDCLDVVFQDEKKIVGVEVKSAISNSADIQRGLFQAVKYHAVLSAMENVSGKNRKVEVYLAMKNPFPPDMIWIRNTLGVEVIDSFGKQHK